MPMMRPDLLSWLLAAFAAAALLWADRFPDKTEKVIPAKAHRILCIFFVISGCALRLWNLSGLPAGLTAEEALTGIQAKSLWQTGGFFGAGGLTTQLPQWTGESAGPMLAALTAPFAGLFGLNALAVRLPLALLSCCALPAAYGIGKRLAGERGARWMLAIYALCPFFVQTARFTAAASLSFVLLPVALYFAIRALDSNGFLAAACAVLVMLCYTQDLYFFLSPALILVLCLGVLLHRKGKGIPGAALTGLIALILCVPGMLTIYACREGGEDIRILGILCPHLESFDKSANLFARLAISWHPELSVWHKLWYVLCGGFFQDVMHQNIAGSFFFPDGMTPLNLFSVPLAAAGALFLLTRGVQGKKPAAAVRLVLGLGAVTLLTELFFGSVGLQEVTGTTSVWDHAQLFPFTALLMLAILVHMEERSRKCALCLTAAFIVGGIATGVWLFGGNYAKNANICFADFEQAAAQASSIREKSGAKLLVTAGIYPHTEPEAAAEAMLLYASDADMRTACQNPEAYGEVAWVGGEEADPHTLYVLTRKEVTNLDWSEDDFDMQEFGRYTVLIPKGLQQ